MRNKTLSAPLPLWVHLTAWVLIAVILNQILSIDTEKTMVIGGQAHRIVHSTSLFSYILVSLAAKAILIYGWILWGIPLFLQKRQPTRGIIVFFFLPAITILLEYGGYQWLNACQGAGAPETTQVGDYRIIVVPEEKDKLKASLFTAWNIGLYLFAGVFTGAWFFIRGRNTQNKQESTQPLMVEQLLLQAAEIVQKPAPPAHNLVAPEGAGTIDLKSGLQIHRVKVDDILFLKKEGNYFTVYTIAKKIVIRQNMEEALKMLPAGLFIRVHRSYIVSTRHIIQLESTRLMIGEHWIPIGDVYKAALFKSR